MSENISVAVPAGGCVDCSNCGLCGKGSNQKTEIVVESVNGPKAADAEAVVTGEIPCVVAVDLGTTTVGMYLVNALTGEQMGVFVALNPQQIHGADVISRITNADEEKRKELRALILETIENGVRKVSGDRHPSRIVISGNTVMGYLLMGYDTSKLGVYPFEVEHTGIQNTTICGIDTVLVPGISAFVGGDIVSGLYTLGFHEKEEVGLLLDLGTNAEMVLGNRNKRIATSAAAGPAFDQKVHGTQLIAALATMLREEKMDATGCLKEEYEEMGCIVGRLLVKQEEIRSLQMAKGAVAAGISLLLKEYGIGASEVDKVYLAGGFGFYLDVESAFAIGLLPEEFRGKVTVVGNTSLEGACRYGTDEAADRGKLEHDLAELVNHTEELNLAEVPGFEETFIKSLNF